MQIDECKDYFKYFHSLDENITKKLLAVYWYQTNPYVHPLTCISSNHRNLIPFIENNEIELLCLDCNYRQKKIPEIIFELYKSQNI